MTPVTLEDAIHRFDVLIEQVEAGATFLITRPGRPSVLLQPITREESS